MAYKQINFNQNKELSDKIKVGDNVKFKIKNTSKEEQEISTKVIEKKGNMISFQYDLGTLSGFGYIVDIYINDMLVSQNIQLN